MSNNIENFENNDINLNSLVEMIEQENFKSQPKERKSQILDENIENIIVNNEEKIIPQKQNMNSILKQSSENTINLIGLSLHKQTLYFIVFLIAVAIILWFVYKNKLIKKKDDKKEE